MLQLHKTLAFGILLLLGLLLADSLYWVSWVKVASTDASLSASFKELREPLVLLLLSLFYIHYYVGALKKENKERP